MLTWTPPAVKLLTVKLRYKEPAARREPEAGVPVARRRAALRAGEEDFKFAAAVAGFGMLLRESPHRGNATLADISAWARAGVGSDAGGDRTLVR